jgi:hypothetical protein
MNFHYSSVLVFNPKFSAFRSNIWPLLYLDSKHTLMAEATNFNLLQNSSI